MGNDSDPRNVPTGYDEDETLGRPKDSITTIGKQDSNFGKDRLGVKRMKDTDKSQVFAALTFVLACKKYWICSEIKKVCRSSYFL